MPFLTSGQYGASGPIVEILVGVSEPRRRVLIARGMTPGPAMRLPFIIDTGCDTTMLNEQHMRTLGIEARGTSGILTATSDLGPTQCNTYDVSIAIPAYGSEQLVLPAVEVIGRPLFNHSIEGMLGRDILNRLKVIVDGPRMRYHIER